LLTSWLESEQTAIRRPRPHWLDGPHRGGEKSQAASDGYLATNDAGFQQILAIADAHRLLEEFAAFAAAISRRLGPLQLVLEQAGGTDPELAQLLESSQQELLEYARSVVTAVAATGSLRHRISHGACVDLLWLQIQPANYRRLVAERGWSHQAFQHWHTAAIAATLLEPPRA
jgi:hypothetical protein